VNKLSLLAEVQVPDRAKSGCWSGPMFSSGMGLYQPWRLHQLSRKAILGGRAAQIFGLHMISL
jgi:hypothetical protein